MSILGQALGNQKARKRNDFYPTIDPRVVAPLMVHLGPGTVFGEPCAGERDLIELLERAGMVCDWGLELEPPGDCLRNRWPIAKGDALTLTENDMGAAQVLITNPAWSRPILHALIRHLAQLRPVWLLFDASWAYTKQSAALGHLCTDIVAVGRLKWFPPKGRALREPGEIWPAYQARMKKRRSSDPPDDCSWYCFDAKAAAAAGMKGTSQAARFHFPVARGVVDASGKEPLLI